ncbi:MAG: signal peptide peptidase SppA [Pseudomonadota bacterium]|nr:signal peptide peptidase SppA [Pseudomonadota bacterium]
MRYITRFFALFGLVVFLAIAGTVLWVNMMLGGPKPLPPSFILEYTLDGDIRESPSTSPLSALLGSQPGLHDLVGRIRRAADDTRVKGFIVQIGSSGLGLAQIQELRDAVEFFRKNGKPAVAFAETFGEFSPGQKLYWLASAFDTVWLQPVGMVGLTPLSLEMPFAADAVNSLGLQPEIGQRMEYKTAFSPLTDKNLTPANREQYTALLNDLSDQIIQGIAQGRNMDPAKVRTLMDQGPFLDQEALSAGLVDHLGYYDEARAETLKKAGEKTEAVDMADWTPEASKDAPRMALVHLSGLIVRGDGKLDPLTGGMAAGAASIAEGIEEAVKDKKIKAIVVRIDSGGGSPAASETIRRAVALAKEAAKPVVVSMSNAAASGGYWVAMSASAIVAQPSTLTGSIGVVGGKIATEETWKKLGITWEQLSAGQGSPTLWSQVQPYSPEDRKKMEAMLDWTYEAFVRGVAQERKLPMDRVRDIARGRVWSGARAKELGLVDELGGLNTAVRKARILAGLPEEGPTALVPYPQPKQPFGNLLRSLRQLGVQSEMLLKTLSWIAPLFEAGAPLSALTRTGAIAPLPSLVE